MSKRGELAPRPPSAGQWKLKLANNQAATGWDDLCRQAPGPLAIAWDHLADDPRQVHNPDRQGRLKGSLAHTTVGGTEYDQWQYEVTGGGRIWYVIDDDSRTVHITLASTGHPKQTD